MRHMAHACVTFWPKTTQSDANATPFWPNATPNRGDREKANQGKGLRVV
jgi:hypothetical protein